ncbi:hypothetical protein DXG01_004048 [Tephrocybe rancida]|nr:hypothetical protein DXG01_004048 [Tephrocybe rancida]
MKPPQSSPQMPPALQARQDPYACLPALLDYVNLNPAWAAHPALVNLYISQFNLPPATPMPLYAEAPAVYALCGLSMASDGDNLDTLSTIDPVWRNLWNWMPTVYRKLIVREYSTVHTSIRATMSIMIYFLRGSTFTSAFAATKGVLAFALEMYIDLARYPSQGDDTIDSRGQYACLTLHLILASPLCDLYEVVKTVGYNRHRAVRDLLLPVYLSAHGGEAWMCLFTLVFNVHITMLTRIPEFYHTLPTKTVISTICQCLSRVIAEGIPKHDPTEIKDRAFGTNTNLRAIVMFWEQYLTQIAYGHTWAIHALQEGMLSLIFRIFDGNDVQRDIGLYLTHILNSLQLHVLHRPVLWRLKMDPTIQQPLCTADDRICKEWKLLQDAVLYSDTAHKDFDALKMPVPGLECVYPLKIRSNKHSTFSATREVHPRSGAAQIARSCSITQRRVNETTGGATGSAVANIAQTIQAARDRFLLAKETPPPYVLIIDYVRQAPLVVNVKTLDEQDDPNQLVLDRMPVLIPYIRVPYGTEDPYILVSPQLSGKLFGWVE